MLPNFENYTADLSAQEQKHAYRLAVKLENRKGKPITSKEIVKLFGSVGIKTNEPTVRKMINHICRFWLPNLIGTQKGYFVTNDVKELKRAATTLQSRANENNRRAEFITDYLKLNYGLNGK